MISIYFFNHNKFYFCIKLNHLFFLWSLIDFSKVQKWLKISLKLFVFELLFLKRSCRDLKEFFDLNWNVFTKNWWWKTNTFVLNWGLFLEPHCNTIQNSCHMLACQQSWIPPRKFKSNTKLFQRIFFDEL